ncbi:MAG: hypothetical protein R2719_13130 [Micropruina sp.]
MERDAGPGDEQVDPDWDPDETVRFRPAQGSRQNAKNTAALIALAVALVAAVASLAWLIGQAVGGAGATPTSPRPVSSASTPAALSTVVPRNATVCTHESARSSNTSCTVATRVLREVRTLGTDLPDTFRVTIVDPQTRKNATYVCQIKSWIECGGPRDDRVWVRRLV